MTNLGDVATVDGRIARVVAINEGRESGQERGIWREVEGLTVPELVAWACRSRVRLAGTLGGRLVGCAGCFDQSWNVFQPPGTAPLRCGGCPVTRARRSKVG